MRQILGSFFALTVLSGCLTRPVASLPDTTQTRVEIRRTSDGIPHIKATNWRGLGYGYGYAQAEDNLCTMAEAFVTYRGERSRYFGADARLKTHSTLGNPRNIDSDFFFKLVYNSEVGVTYKASQVAEMQQLIAGFAAGYNRYLQVLRSTSRSTAHRECKDAEWLAEVSEMDVYARLFAANLAGGSTTFMAVIATATPPQTSIGNHTPTSFSPAKPLFGLDAGEHESLARHVSSFWIHAGGRTGIGSNAIALGGEATSTGGGLLLGNPHWYWAGPDRFYQAQLTIPGELDVAGASFLGVPVIMLGFNNDIAWAHTVSPARRVGVFELSLVPGSPTTYLVDGREVPMTAVPLTVQVKSEEGELKAVARTLYRTQYGPVVELGGMSPALKWTTSKAFALRDINVANFRIFENFLAWGRASSLQNFMKLQSHFAAMPWVSTLAVGRNDVRAWYADIGNVPNVPDALASACTTALGQAFRKGAPGVPFLDGSRSSCDWHTDPQSAQAGAMPPARMPSLLREDYVANMNNSYWLANPVVPLTGFDQVLGGEGEELSLRARLGHRLINRRLSRLHDDEGAPINSATLRSLALGSQSMSAILFKGDVLDTICKQSNVSVALDIASHMTFAPPEQVPIDGACRVLRNWDGTGNSEARGAFLWDEFWARAAKLDKARLFKQAFEANDPLNTPRALNASDPAIAQALGAAVLSVQRSGHALDASRGETLYVNKHDHNIALYGGCDGGGYFTSACTLWGVPSGIEPKDVDLLGNSHMQVVSFGQDGVTADVMLAHGESDDPASIRFSDATQRYAKKQWTRWRFYESEIMSDKGLSVLRFTLSDTK